MKVLIFLVEGFEEVEALTVVDYLRRMDIKIDMISTMEEKEVKGAHNIKVIADKLIDEINNLDLYKAAIIPGGLPGATNLRDDKKVIDIIKEMYNRDKLIAAICAGPIVLERAGILEGKKTTSYPGFEDQLKKSIYKEDNVVSDDNIITSRGPSLAVEFAVEMVRYLLDDDKAEELKKDILYKG